VFLSGTLIDTCTTAGVNGATIIFAFLAPHHTQE
jgi:hypothetical protein